MDLAKRELECDTVELQNLLRVAGRTRVRALLEGAIAENQKELLTLKASEPEVKAASPEKKSVVVQLSNYGWDQSEQFMKIYLTDLKGVQSLAQEQVQSSFEKRVCRLTVSDLNGKTYQLSVGPLFHEIVPEESKHRVKTDMVVLMLKKVKVKETWPYVVLKEKGKDKPLKKAPDVDDKEDPQAGLMNMLKKMYDDGDDEMKRTIAKSWEQSRRQETGL